MKKLFSVIVWGVFLASVGLIFVSKAFAVTTTTTSVHIQVNGRDVVNTTESTSGAEYIKSYLTDTAIHTDGTIHIAETIEYYFGTPRHGIIRTIPYVKTNADGKRYAMTISGITVKDSQGASYTKEVSRANDALTIKVGDADRTITGLHTYVIDYDVAGALTYFPGHDELYWNSIGTQWKIPILSAQSMVHLPANIADKDIHTECFIGVQQSVEKNCTPTMVKGVVVAKSTRPLAAYEGLTTVTALPKGIVAQLEPIELVPFFETPNGKVLAIVLAVFAIFWYIILPIQIVWRWWKVGRDPKPTIGQAKAWFSPPTTKTHRALTAAETGSLVDESVDMRDIYASLVDLARRGYIKIIEKKKEEFDVEKVNDWDENIEILPFEKQLLDGVFEGSDRVSLSDLDLHVTFEAIKKTIYESLTAQGFFAENPQKIRLKYTALGVLSFVTFNPILLIVAITFGQHMPRKTLFGAEAAAMARALKTFLTSQEKKLTFQADKQMMFEKLLPYAIAFGVEEIWAKRFKDIALLKPDWYVSTSGGRFNSIVFASALGSGMTVSFASSVNYKSSSGHSSGFSSGGGFSGGGGGGGGGGSW